MVLGDCITYCDCDIDSYGLDWGCGHILERQFDILGGDDDGDAGVGWVDDAVHGVTSAENGEKNDVAIDLRAAASGVSVSKASDHSHACR